MVSSCSYKEHHAKTYSLENVPSRFLRIQLGFLLFGLAIALMIRGNIGTSALGGVGSGAGI